MYKLATSCAALALVCATTAFSHQMTEKYIPVGYYPGLAGKHTVTGTIDAIDAGAKTVTIATSSGSKTARITSDTLIWLDRSLLKVKNLNGAFGDLQAGRKAEMKTADGDQCVWVKVQIAQ